MRTDTTLNDIREMVKIGLDNWNTVADNPEFGGDIVDCVSDAVWGFIK